MPFRIRPLVAQFSIRDLLWLMLTVCWLTAWWHTKRENAALRVENEAKSAALQAKSQALQAAAKKEATLRRETELIGQLTKSLGAGLAKKDAELRESLDKRQEVLNALRILKENPAGSN